MIQSIDPEKLANKEGSSRIYVSPWEEQVEKLCLFDWEQAGMGTWGIKLRGRQKGRVLKEMTMGGALWSQVKHHAKEASMDLKNGLS